MPAHTLEPTRPSSPCGPQVGKRIAGGRLRGVVGVPTSEAAASEAAFHGAQQAACMISQMVSVEGCWTCGLLCAMCLWPVPARLLHHTRTHLGTSHLGTARAGCWPTNARAGVPLAALPSDASSSAALGQSRTTVQRIDVAFEQVGGGDDQIQYQGGALWGVVSLVTLCAEQACGVASEQM